MKSLIVLYGPFNCNSGIQVFHLANGLCRDGWEVAVTAPSPTEDVLDVGEPLFECLTYEDVVRDGPRWRGERLLIHAWTPREGVRRLAAWLARRARAPYVVHLEDNEEHLASVSAKMPFVELRSLPRRAQKELAGNDHVHPRRYPRFVSRAAGLTMVTEELNEFNVAGRPYAVAPPVVDTEEFAPGPDESERRRELGLRPDEFVLVYHGNVHSANRGEIESLYRAVHVLRQRGLPVRLVKLGGNPPPSDSTLDALRADVIEVGVTPRADVVGYLRMADAFVQPGKIDDFNIYRVPSKIPEFLAMGRPVVVPACNIGRQLTDGENALLLREGTAFEIAAKVEQLIGDRELAGRLGKGGREFAVQHLDISSTVATLNAFLRRILE